MPNPTNSLLSYLRVIVGAWRDDQRDDAKLLARFAEAKDEAAFAALVWRHGAMVWQTCRRLLNDTPDAEDAFQVTFLALASKAGKLSIKSPAGWLHNVARQTALNTRANARSRRSLEQRLKTIAQSKETAEDTNRAGLYAALDEELASLPERVRLTMVLCYLENKSQVETARILGCSRGVIQRRLARGEKILRKQMEKRGLALGTMLVTSVLKETGNPLPVPSRLIESTTRAAVAFRAGTFTGAAADGAQKLLSSLATKETVRKFWWAVLAWVGIFGVGGAGLVAWKMIGAGSDAVTPDKPDAPKIIAPKEAPGQHDGRVDLYGDPLPKDALVRIGTTRFRGTGTDMWRINMNDKRPFRVALSPDGRILASSHDPRWISSDTFDKSRHVIRFWDMATGKQLHETVLKGSWSDCRIVFSTDGKMLAAAKKREIWLLDAVTGQPSEQPLSGSWPLVFTPDGKTLACMTGEASLSFYDVASGKLLRMMTVGNLTPIKNGDSQLASLTFAVFSRDGQFLACIEKTGIVHLLDVKTGKELTTLKDQQVLTLAFADDGKLVTGGKDKAIRIWDAKTSKELRQLGTMAEMPLLVDFLPEGKTVLATCAGQVRCWDVATGHETRPVLDCKGLLCPQILSNKGTKLIERVQDSLSIWDVATGKEIGPAAGAPRSCMDCLTFSPDGKFLATHMGESGSSEIQLWEIATGKQVGSFAVPVNVPNFPDMGFSWEMTWPSRNMLIARAFPDHPRFDSTMFQLVRENGGNSIIQKQTYPSEVKFSPDGQVLAHWQNQNFELLEVATKKKLADVPFTIQSTVQRPNRILDFDWKPAFSADHQLFATHSPGDTMITLWEASTGHKLYSFNVPLVMPRVSHGNPKYDKLIGFSPDGRLVVTQDFKTRDVSLWEHISGQLRLRLPAPPDCLNDDCSVAFSPNGRLLAIGCMVGSKEERLIHIWDLVTSQECQQLQGHQAGGVGSPQVAFSPDGERLASAGMDYTVLVWDVKQPTALKSLSQPMDQEEMQILKTTLYDADAVTAYRAICKLRQVPEQAVPLVAECLRPITLTPETKRIAQKTNRLIEDLDSDDFLTRVKAAEELRKELRRKENEPIVEKTLHQALEKEPSVEVSKAISQMFSELADEQKRGGALSTELTRMFRGIEVLELIHNDAACEVLQKVVDAPPRPEVRREAEAALKRLAAHALAPARP